MSFPWNEQTPSHLFVLCTYICVYIDINRNTYLFFFKFFSTTYAAPDFCYITIF